MVIRRFLKSRDNQVMLLLVFLSGVFIITGILLLNGKSNEGPKIIPNTPEEIIWNDFESKVLGFKLKYPKHFDLFEDDKTYGSTFNFYPPSEKFTLDELDGKPLTHIDEASHFSIFPTGVPAQGSTFPYSEKDFVNEKGVEFTLREFRTGVTDDVWALMAIPKNEIKGWKSWGFIWVSSRVNELDYVCSNGAESKSPELCNPFEGDQLFKIGKVDKEFIQIGREILNSFETI